MQLEKESCQKCLVFAFKLCILTNANHHTSFEIKATNLNMYSGLYRTETEGKKKKIVQNFHIASRRKREKIQVTLPCAVACPFIE